MKAAAPCGIDKGSRKIGPIAQWVSPPSCIARTGHWERLIIMPTAQPWRRLIQPAQPANKMDRG